MSGATWDTHGFHSTVVQDCHLLWRAFPDPSHGFMKPDKGPATPPAPKCRRFGLFRFRSPLLTESQLIYFPVGTEMCHFPTFAERLPMDSGGADPGCPGPGCPIRGSWDPLVCSSPRLIAAYHALHRLSAPRHPPCTLSNFPSLIRNPAGGRPSARRAAGRSLVRAAPRGGATGRAGTWTRRQQRRLQRHCVLRLIQSSIVKERRRFGYCLCVPGPRPETCSQQPPDVIW